MARKWLSSNARHFSRRGISAPVPALSPAGLAARDIRFNPFDKREVPG